MIDTTGYKVLEDGTIISRLGRVMRGSVNDKGYVRVKINGKDVKYHRVVAQELVPNPDNKPCVNHIDGNKQNNHPSNLEWVTHSENTRHSFDSGLQKTILTEEQVLEARWLYEIGVKQTEIAEAYGVSPKCIFAVVHRKTWKHI